MQGTPEARYEDLVVVTSDGSMIWVPMVTIYATCPMDLTRFPYDVQTCTMVFGSWTHTSNQMAVTVSTQLGFRFFSVLFVFFPSDGVPPFFGPVVKFL